MKNDQENFEALRKLMALKRHEVPPPGYFSRLPGTIITRIERGEGRLSFWERITGDFSVRPAFAYAFVVAACGALTTSIYSGRTEAGTVPAQPALAAGWRTATSAYANASGYDPAEP